MKTILLGSLLFSLALVVNADDTISLQQALSGTHRSAQHKARDPYRHAQQTLAFFDIKNDMTVVEIWPGGAGWYTEVLAPYLKTNGQLYAAHFAADSNIPYFQKNLKKFKKKIAARPEIYANIVITELHPPEKLLLAPKASADLILTFRNVHNWMKTGQAETVFKAMFATLKPGGVLGVVEHRLAADIKADPQALSGYVSEQQVLDLAKQAGFTFNAKAEINANPKDSTVHPEGVWTLPPSLRLKQQQRDKYLAIGESDRMTLKFVKP